MRFTLLFISMALSTFGCKGDKANEPASEKAAPPSTSPAVKSTTPTKKSAPVSVSVTVGDAGYTPDQISARGGVPLALTFTRTSESVCGEEIVFPKYDIKKPLPLNQAVTINLTPKADETIAFTCGMGMFKGSIVAVQ
ncbi:MAG: cupredoxin domain-containing protein [Bradymonadia bacterium]